MDNYSNDTMKWMLEQIKMPDKELKILDIGSMDLNGAYRYMFPNPKWKYVGLDMEPGKNVDVVTKDPYSYPFYDNCFDVVISGNCLEHVEDTHRWADEAIRVCKPGGYICIAVPSSWGEHKYPVDCWRVYPDGLNWLFSKRVTSMSLCFVGNCMGNPVMHESVCYGFFRKNFLGTLEV